MFLLVISVIHTKNILKITKGLLSGKSSNISKHFPYALGNGFHNVIGWKMFYETEFHRLILEGTDGDGELMIARTSKIYDFYFLNISNRC
jgi:hypothetical protein